MLLWKLLPRISKIQLVDRIRQESNTISQPLWQLLHFGVVTTPYTVLLHLKNLKYIM